MVSPPYSAFQGGGRCDQRRNADGSAVWRIHRFGDTWSVAESAIRPTERRRSPVAVERHSFHREIGRNFTNGKQRARSKYRGELSTGFGRR